MRPYGHKTAVYDRMAARRTAVRAHGRATVLRAFGCMAVQTFAHVAALAIWPYDCYGRMDLSIFGGSIHWDLPLFRVGFGLCLVFC